MQTLKEQIEEIQSKHQALIESNPGLVNTEWEITHASIEEMKEFELDSYKISFPALFNQYRICCCTEPAIFAYSGDGKVSSSKHSIDELYSPI